VHCLLLLVGEVFWRPLLEADRIRHVHVVGGLLQLDVLVVVLLGFLLVHEWVVLVSEVIPPVQLHLLQRQLARVRQVRGALDGARSEHGGLLAVVVLLLRKLDLPEQLVLVAGAPRGH